MPTTPAPAPATGGALLRRALRRNAPRLGGASALIAVWQVCEAMVPVMIGVVVDRAVATGSWSALALWGGVLCALFATLAFSYRGGAIVGEGALQREGHRLRTEVSGHLLDPRGARADQVPGDLLAVATGDADQAAAVLRQAWFAVAAVVGFAVTAVVLARIDLVLTLVVLVGVPVALLINHLLAGPLTRRSAVRQEALGRATGIATDLVTGLRPLKGIGAEDVALARYRHESHRAAEASVAAARWEGLLYGATQGLSGVVLVVVALVAGSRALDGALSIGELIAVVGLAQFVAEPLQTLAYFVAQLAQSRASADRLVTVLATPRLLLAGEAAATGPADLALHDVHSGTLRGVDLRAEPGELVAVVAGDPADAAALARLLRGELRPDRGEVRLGGTPLTDLTLAETRRLLLVADHQVDLFEGTLRSNVDPGGRLDDERLAAVLVASAADEVVAHCAGGLEEPVTVGGTTLSGGQRQRVGLARALAAPAPVLVLHDPTTAVDAATEHRIAAALVAERHPGEQGAAAATSGAPTTLLLTSSPVLLARAHRVVHLDAGRVRATGTHAQLVRDDSAYREAVLR